MSNPQVANRRAPLDGAPVAGQAATRGAWVRTLDPGALIIGLLLFSTPLMISVDMVSSSVALALVLVVCPFAGVSYWCLLRRGWPVLIAAVLASVSMILYGRPQGAEYFHLGLIHVTDNSLYLGAAIGIRVLAIGLPAIVFLPAVNPTALGDSLAQVWRLPATFVVGIVAGVRMITLFTADFHALERARRSRGMGDAPALLRALSISFALVVLALRRSAKLATTMEARGFGGATARTWARKAQIRGRDLTFILGCTLAAALSIGAAVCTGAFHFLGA